MSDDEVDKLVKEAEANREADKKKKESIEARNHADSLVYQTEKTLEENKGKYEEADGEEVKKKLEDLKAVLAKSDVTKDDIEALSLHLKGMYYTLTKINLKLY